MAGLHGFAYGTVYCSSKFAVRGNVSYIHTSIV